MLTCYGPQTVLRLGLHWACEYERILSCFNQPAACTLVRRYARHTEFLFKIITEYARALTILLFAQTCESGLVTPGSTLVLTESIQINTDDETA